MYVQTKLTPSPRLALSLNSSGGFGYSITDPCKVKVPVIFRDVPDM